jgi:hypothetical protein
MTLTHGISSAEEVYETGLRLLKDHWNPRVPLRLVGIGFDKVLPGAPGQGELFLSDYDRKGIVEKTIFGLSKKDPKGTPVKASLLGRKRRHSGI